MPVYTQVLKTVLDRTGGEIGLSNYPTPAGVDADKFRQALNNKIIRHYYNREIGLETTSLFVYSMETKANEIMPYFCKLYESELLTFDPLTTVNMESTSSQNSENESTGETKSAVNGSTTQEGESASKSKTYNSSFPQQMVTDETTGLYADAGVDAFNSGNNTGSATDVRNVENDETSKSTESANASSTTKGYSMSPSSLLTAYRATLLNVDVAVINQFEELFMQVFDTGDSYTGGL